MNKQQNHDDIKKWEAEISRLIEKINGVFDNSTLGDIPHDICPSLETIRDEMLETINTHYTMEIDFTEQDCHDLLEGVEHNWTFPAELPNGEYVEVDIRLFNSDLQEENDNE